MFQIIILTMEIREKISLTYGAQTFFGAVVYGARIFLSCSSGGARTFSYNVL